MQSPVLLTQLPWTWGTCGLALLGLEIFLLPCPTSINRRQSSSAATFTTGTDAALDIDILNLYLEVLRLDEITNCPGWELI